MPGESCDPRRGSGGVQSVDYGERWLKRRYEYRAIEVANRKRPAVSRRGNGSDWVEYGPCRNVFGRRRLEKDDVALVVRCFRSAQSLH